MAKMLRKNETGFMALGGLGEIGRNCYIYEHNNKILIIDAGIKFPEDSLLGVDYVLPDFTYLKENESKIVGLVITHGHEDHIGGIPFLLKTVNIKNIYAGEIAKEMILSKLKEHKIKANIQAVYDGEKIALDEFEIEPFDMIHSIPNALGFAIETSNGKFIHTSDFKWDFSAKKNYRANITRMASFASENIVALASDSTNALVKNFSNSEYEVAQNLEKIIAKSSNKRIILSSFSSNVDRVSNIIEILAKHNRKIAIIGRSMEKNIQIGRKVNYIKTKSSFFIKTENINNYNDNEVAILCTGSQGETLAALNKIANHQHKHVDLTSNDTIVFTSNPIPGNTISVGRLINTLVKSNVEIITHSANTNIHASGHGSSKELQLLINLIQPQILIPIHGILSGQIEHAKLGVETNFVQKKNTYVLKNYEMICYSKNSKGLKTRINNSLNMKESFVDGTTITDDYTKLLHERDILSNEGLVIIFGAIDRKTRRIVRRPIMLSRGFIHLNESRELITNLQNKIFQKMVDYINTHEKIVEKELNAQIRNQVSQMLKKETRRNPHIVCTITVL